jgi:hypothetical protein
VRILQVFRAEEVRRRAATGEDERDRADGGETRRIGAG